MTSEFFEADEQLLQAVVAWSHQRILKGEDPRTGARDASELEVDLSGSLCPEGIGGTEALRRFTDVIVQATRAQGHEMNLAYVPAAPTPASLIFDLAVGAAEIFGGLWEAGAGAIHAENQALAWLASLAGFPPTAGGTFMPGATVGTLSALSAARERGRVQGLQRDRWAFASAHGAHSSVAAAARTLDCDVLDVQAGPAGRMTAAGLRVALDSADIELGVFAVVATAGTTNAGVVDELAGIAEVCRERGLWLHIDGAYGLAALASPTVRPLFAGIEHADSFVVDPHKWLFAPYDCCALVYREPQWAAVAHAQNASYLDHVDRERWNPADYAIHLSRRARGLPFWFSLATYGTDKYGAAIDQTMATASAVTDYIGGVDHLEMVIDPELTVLLFRRIGWDAATMLAWSTRNSEDGVVLCMPTSIEGESVFRLCIVNPDTRADAVAAVLETMR